MILIIIPFGLYSLFNFPHNFGPKISFIASFIGTSGTLSRYSYFSLNFLINDIHNDNCRIFNKIGNEKAKTNSLQSYSRSFSSFIILLVISFSNSFENKSKHPTQGFFRCFLTFTSSEF